MCRYAVCEVSGMYVNPAMPVKDEEIGRLMERAGSARNKMLTGRQTRAGLAQNEIVTQQCNGATADTMMIAARGGWNPGTGQATVMRDYNAPETSGPRVAHEVRRMFCSAIK